MEIIKLREEYIKLGQALKAANLVADGVDAKFVIQDGLVKVNGQTEKKRKKKLYAGDKVEFDGKIILIEKYYKICIKNQLRQFMVKITIIIVMKVVIIMNVIVI